MIVMRVSKKQKKCSITRRIPRKMKDMKPSTISPKMLSPISCEADFKKPLFSVPAIFSKHIINSLFRMISKLILLTKKDGLEKSNNLNIFYHLKRDNKPIISYRYGEILLRERHGIQYYSKKNRAITDSDGSKIQQS